MIDLSWGFKAFKQELVVLEKEFVVRSWNDSVLKSGIVVNGLIDIKAIVHDSLLLTKK